MKMQGFRPVSALAMIALLSFAEVSMSLKLPANLELDLAEKLLKKSKRELTDEETLRLLALSNTLSKQVMLQQTYVEERIRSDGGSGLKQTRLANQGTESYDSNSYTGGRVAAIHEHCNNNRVAGMGEIIAVLNGVEFRTRHNDFWLVMPSNTSDKYHETEEIEYPDVPPEVLAKGTVEEQITEMKEFFRAWKEEDSSIRDYRKYFRPALCYLEGTWTTSDEDDIEESFESDRHHIDATSWLDLQEKIRFTSYTGKKDTLENYAYLPTTISDQADGILQLAQWNYRILCHKLNRYVEVSRLGLIDDLHSRMYTGSTMEQHAEKRSARYGMAPDDKKGWVHKKKNYDFLDLLMSEIPGANNYGANFTDDSLGTTALHYETGEVLNAGYYHRWIQMDKRDAMGSSKYHRSYSDANLFFAMTDKENIAPMTLKTCDKNDENCVTTTQRWTFAIPLEMIYLTPLYKWNPYNLKDKGWGNSGDGLTVTANGRNGEDDLAKAYDGINHKVFYQTPAAFYNPSSSDEGDNADTAVASVFVLSQDGTETHEVAASGTRILLPEIPGVGKLRTRFPIMPTHQEGSGIWKEIAALRDFVLSPLTQKDMYYEEFPTGRTAWTDPEPPSDQMVRTQMRPAADNYGNHIHYVYLTPSQVLALKEVGATLTVNSTQNFGHTHELLITNREWGNFGISECDGRRWCWDNHRMYLTTAPLTDD